MLGKHRCLWSSDISKEAISYTNFTADYRGAPGAICPCLCCNPQHCLCVLEGWVSKAWNVPEMPLACWVTQDLHEDMTLSESPTGQTYHKTEGTAVLPSSWVAMSSDSSPEDSCVKGSTLFRTVFTFGKNKAKQNILQSWGLWSGSFLEPPCK